MVLDDQHKQACDELEQKKAHLMTIRPATAKMKKDQHRIKQLEKELDHCNVLFCQIQAENKNLKKEIDVWRKEQRNQNRVNSGLTSEITQTIKKVKELNNFTYQG